MNSLVPGGVPLADVLPALRLFDPSARAAYLYDVGALEVRARRFTNAFAALRPTTAYAFKANALPVLTARLAALGWAADTASLGEMLLARRAGFAPSRQVVNGNGKSPEEIDAVAREGALLVNADAIEELDDLQAAAARHRRRLRVALRVNPGIGTPGHPYVATGDQEAKFGVSPAQALEAWGSASRWPDLRLDGLHLHIGSQILDPAPLERAVDLALELRDEAARRGSPLDLLDLGGGFGIDYEGRDEFPLEAFATRLTARLASSPIEVVLEPGRWLVGPVGVLLAQVLRVKQRDGRRFVTLAAGMNDFLRPALYGARHRIVAVSPRPGEHAPTVVVGPVCESADVFDDAARLPPLDCGDVVALLDAGAYGASMSSNYNGRGRLSELVAERGRLVLAAATAPVGEGPEPPRVTLIEP